MESAELFTEARRALPITAQRVADLCRSTRCADVPIPGSSWTVRDAAVHLACMAEIYTEIAAGTPGLIADFDPATVARRNSSQIADIPESDPDRIAELLLAAANRFLETTAHRRGDELVRYVEFSTLDVELAQLAAILLGEFVLHGYDIATALEIPWPGCGAVALVVLAGYLPVLPLVTDPARTAGHTAGYGVELRGGPRFTVRFVDGELRLEPPDAGPVDCTLRADPVAFLMTATGRMSQEAAITLGLLDVGGARPELARGFTGLFALP